MLCGFGPASIAAIGCDLTTMAMIESWEFGAMDPPALNALFKSKGIFKNCGGGDIECLYPDALPDCFPDRWQKGALAWSSPTDPAPLDLLDTSTDGTYVAVKIDNRPVGGNVPYHFMPIYSYTKGQPASSIMVVDAYDGQIKPLARYGSPPIIVTAIMRYRRISAPAPAPTPTPVPTPIPGPPIPQPSPFTGDPDALQGKFCWEFTEQADYAALKAAGFDGVLIRAFNGDGGSTAQNQLAAWKVRAPLARAAGLRPVAWTYWYGPGEPGYTEPDSSAYLARCAAATAALGLDTPAFVVDAEAHQLDGLGVAMKALRDTSGKAVFLCPPGDPNQYGFKVDWKALDAAVDGYVPQMYTEAWGAAISLDTALAEWTPTPPLYPASDEQDPLKAAAWVADVSSRGLGGYSYWRWGVGSAATLQAYGRPTIVPPTPVPTPRPIPPEPPPMPTPAPTPPPDLSGPAAFLEDLLLRLVAWLRSTYGKK